MKQSTCTIIRVSSRHFFRIEIKSKRNLQIYCRQLCHRDLDWVVQKADFHYLGIKLVYVFKLFTTWHQDIISLEVANGGRSNLILKLCAYYISEFSFLVHIESFLLWQSSRQFEPPNLSTISHVESLSKQSFRRHNRWISRTTALLLVAWLDLTYIQVAVEHLGLSLWNLPGIVIIKTTTEVNF
jgi:hypothetical protein